MSKKTYQTPSLTNLGSVEDVTLGWGQRRSHRSRRRMRRPHRRNWWDTAS